MHQHQDTSVSGDVDLILARLSREAVLVKIIKVGVEKSSFGRDPLAWVVHQHVHQQIIPRIYIDTFRRRKKQYHTL